MIIFIYNEKETQEREAFNVMSDEIHIVSKDDWKNSL